MKKAAFIFLLSLCFVGFARAQAPCVNETLTILAAQAGPRQPQALSKQLSMETPRRLPFSGLSPIRQGHTAQFQTLLECYARRLQVMREALARPGCKFQVREQTARKTSQSTGQEMAASLQQALRGNGVRISFYPATQAQIHSPWIRALLRAMAATMQICSWSHQTER